MTAMAPMRCMASRSRRTLNRDNEGESDARESLQTSQTGTERAARTATNEAKLPSALDCTTGSLLISVMLFGSLLDLLQNWQICVQVIRLCALALQRRLFSRCVCVRVQRGVDMSIFKEKLNFDDKSKIRRSDPALHCLAACLRSASPSWTGKSTCAWPRSCQDLANGG